MTSNLRITFKVLQGSPLNLLIRHTVVHDPSTVLMGLLGLFKFDLGRGDRQT